MKRSFSPTRAALAVTLGLAGVAVPAAARAGGDYPSRPIKIVVPYTPGTSPDTLSRLLSEKLAARLGQSVVVENKPGAAAAIGTAYVAKAAPDGYTLMMSLNTHVITPASRKTPYDPVKDFAPIGQIASGQMLILTHPSVPAKTFPEFVAYLKKMGDEVSYSSPGPGSTTHLYSLVLQDMLGTKMRHIPANGMGVAAMDVMQNSSTMLISTVEASRANVASGKLKPMAQTGRLRSQLVPDLPTVAESGYPDYDLSIWVGMYAPAGTPKAIVQRLHDEIGAIMGAPQMRKDLLEKGYDVVLTSPEEFAELNRKEFARWKDVVARHGLQAE
ncbi:tripartite tricarboxylate transporter substrate binding protein [Pigmentiphaga sp. GD03639]|uniref:Bug family tripartite tricarboxylate transporter substrate binding protein n=1 Tax=Pigmentiphaga sp. GD03639 TaxID=2975354 RepID=UPI002449BA84|nr:tripartite tricarboxylate transporter substrate binding protein [Pigmentiphaga sp. GD03639]MDH2236532.1 tripartite tricarboxylate transporter substrate binding protein [Pigmentiphaga sp. GD03639]